MLLILAWTVHHAERRYVSDHWASAFQVGSQSMLPTFRPMDKLLVKPTQSPQRWDVVAYYPPPFMGNLPFVGRVVGLPGESVEVDSGGLIIDGKRTAPPPGLGPYVPYLLFPSGNRDPTPLIACAGVPIYLGADEVFILDDNTTHAADSRYWTRPIPGHQPGALSEDRIIGVVTAIYWPPSRWKLFAK